MNIEVIAYNIASALAAQRGGADRIELCASPGEGGTTPSWGIMKAVRQAISIDVYAMIRPRGGDFYYSHDEFHAMREDILQSQLLSLDGVVFGILTPEGDIDKKRCKKLIDLARPLKVTCHRAFDMTRNPLQALEDCIDVGFDRILTSGQRNKAIEGVDLLAQLVAQAAGRISIMAGSGITPENALALVTKTKVSEIHFSATTFTPSVMQHQNQFLSAMGSDKDSEYQHRMVDEQAVYAMRNLFLKE
jgi:copper homeostasis protein